MATRRRSAAEKARDSKRIADLYLKGWRQVDIAEEVNLGTATISRTINELHAAWLADAEEDIKIARKRELAQIDALQATYWQEWVASQEERLITTTERTSSLPPQGDLGGDKLPLHGLPQRDKASIRKEQRLGDPRYLAGVQWCIERRCAILGIDAPKNIDLTSKGKALPIAIVKMDLDEL